jgi:mRNA interferase MazF
VNRGEVWWVASSSGARRPYLVLTREAAIPVLHSLLAVPATRTIRGIPTEVQLDREDGMPDGCALSLDNLTLMPTEYFVERICTLGPDRMVAVCLALGEATGCRTP